jgi:osomolarity two-component system, sensor histidine kinase SLN1
VTRILLQDALKSFYRGNLSESNWTGALDDVEGALASGGYSSLLQTIVYSRNTTGNSTGLLRATANTTGIVLPEKYPNGSYAMLGDPSDLGYPTALYPNITYNTSSTTDPANPSVNFTLATAFLDFPLNASSALLLGTKIFKVRFSYRFIILTFSGPLQINNSYALLSLTLPIVDNALPGFVLGYMTVVAAASALIDVTQSREGLANTGIVLIIGPNRRENQFKYTQRPATANYTPAPGALNNASVHYILPPVPAPGQSDRHSTYK